MTRTAAFAERRSDRPPPRLSFSHGTLVLDGVVLEGVARHDAQARPKSGSWAWDPRVTAWRCDAIAYPVLREQHRAGLCRYDDQVPLWRHQLRWPRVSLPPLRPEQSQAVAAWKQARRGVIVMPTGTGKTEVALEIMRVAAVSTLVVAPVRDLMYQWHRRIHEGLGYDAGIIGDNLFRIEPVSVTTYDSACIHMERLGATFALLIFDECHHLPGDVRRDAARMSAAPLRLGLTATPERSDGRHADLDWLIGPRVYELPLAAARGKVLADYDVVRIPVRLSDREQSLYNSLARQVRRYVIERRRTEAEFTWERLLAESGNDPQARRVALAYRKKKSIEDRAEEKLRVLEDLFRLHAGSSILVFTDSNAMARDVSRRFLIPCLLNHCQKRERQEILQGLTDGTYPALVANQVLDEGLDVPEVKVAVVIGGTGSTKQAKQRLGRILRRSGNARATLYEIVCADTTEEQRSRHRRDSDAYQGTRHLPLSSTNRRK